MTRFIPPLLAALLAGAPFAAGAQAVVPADHPGFVLAEAIAAQGCVLHQDDVNPLLAEVGLENAQFPEMAVPLMRDGYLRPSGEGTMTLTNWGLCTGEALAEAAAQPGSETTEAETE
ncbi:hypothetical protein A8B78_15595 [Jannaschia sp. EhC01]|nr:hypothetical protein A8B78_15595 [Jannaschia sp. EhC01]